MYSVHMTLLRICSITTRNYNRRYVSTQKTEKEKSTEDLIADIDQLMRFSHFYSTADPWGLAVQTLGLSLY